jgi:putative phosphonate catabolism associated alcohol dehydrogenase
LNLPPLARAAVMTAVGEDLEFREYPIPEPVGREVLVRVACSTICRSDLHTWRGRRPGPMPSILGHEIAGQIVAVGDKVTCDAADQRLRIGDRITWTLHSCCGTCCYCREHHLSMKCRQLRKYGHSNCETPPHLQGGFAEYCLIDEGTGIIRLPDELPYHLAAPLNCAAATVVAGWEAAGLQACQNVLIQGAGGLGCYAAAFASLSGARRIVVTDIDDERFELIARFGATDCINVSQCSQEEAVGKIQRLTGGFGVDSALELAGVPDVVPLGLAALRKGGSYIEIGCSFPNATISIDLSTILWNLLTVRGVHNYDFAHLRKAVQMVSQTLDRFPYDELVATRFPFHEINTALRTAESHTGGRVAIEFDGV